MTKGDPTEDRVDAARERVGEAVTLLVALPRTKAGRSDAPRTGDVMPEYEIRKVKLDRVAGDKLRDLCRHALDQIVDAERVPYGVDTELTSGQVFALEGEADLGELALFRAAAERAATADPIAPSDLDGRVKFYAVVAGDDDRVAFVRKSDPQMHHKAGGFLLSGRDTLAVIEGPVFRLSTGFDFVLAPKWAYVLSQHRFEQLFRDTGLVAGHVVEWVTGVTDHLPMPDDSVDALKEAAARDSRLWRKLRSIHRRGHLTDVSIDQVREYAAGHGMDVDKVVSDGQLVFDPGERFTIMELLNEDLFRGPLTDELFEAQRKAEAGSARPPVGVRPRRRG